MITKQLIGIRKSSVQIKKPIKLICTPMRFYTHNDEALLFEWLNKIPCIKKIEGIGRELHLHIASNSISDLELKDLMGIFDRYKFDAEQLKIFMNDNNKQWFED